MSAAAVVTDPTGASPDAPVRALVHRSRAMAIVLEHVALVASAPRTTVLITGESGVGKELVARAVHARSARAAGPFTAVNCAALSDALLEAELFGYEPGAFTGAAPGGRRGLLAAATGGTLLLDEIGELAPALQAKLLRVLQERVYRRVGGERDLPLEARVIASTNRDLDAWVREGRFRADLYYRLNVVRISVPPLRERPEDVEPLALHFLARAASELSRAPMVFAPGALERLAARSWPGNVRELSNAIQRAALLAGGGEIRAEHVDPGANGGAPTGEAGGASGAPIALELEDCALRTAERALIRRVLRDTGGNRSRAARLLGVNRTTLYDKLRRYGLG